MAKLTLEVSYDFDFILIGISCHEKDYRLCWAVNNALAIDLKKSSHHILELKNKDDVQKYSKYEYINEDTFSEYFILANRSTNGLLVPEQKQTDYFLIVRSNNANQENMIAKLKDVNFINAVFSIDVNSLKSKHNLLF